MPMIIRYQTLNMQFSKVADPDQTQIKHAVHDAYTQRELEGRFLRLGYFTPR